jgi:hypothetical protein
MSIYLNYKTMFTVFLMFNHCIIWIIPYRILFFIIDIFYPPGEPLSPHLLCCGPG